MLGDKKNQIHKKTDNPPYWLLILVYIASLAFGIWGKTTEMGLAIISGFILIAFANMDKILRIKGAGVELEMKVQQAVDDAYAKIEDLKRLEEHLRELTKFLALFSLDQLTYSNRLTDANHLAEDNYRRHKLREDINNICHTLNIDDDLLRLTNNRFHNIHAKDHLRCIQSKLYHLVGKSETTKKLGRMATLMEQCLDEKSPPSIQCVKEAIADVKIDKIDDELQMLLDDYEYYLKNSNLRHKEAGCPSKY